MPSSTVATTRCAAVGTPAASITSFANALEPSSRAAAASGPKQRTRSAASASASPATSGASGPTTTRSTPASRAARASASRLAGRRVERPRVAPDPRVARRAQHLRRLRRAQQGANERVLAPARADDEDPHTDPMKSSIGIAESDS